MPISSPVSGLMTGTAPTRVLEKEIDHVAELGLGLDGDDVRAHELDDRHAELPSYRLRALEREEAPHIEVSEVAIAQHADDGGAIEDGHDASATAPSPVNARIRWRFEAGAGTSAPPGWGDTGTHENAVPRTRRAALSRDRKRAHADQSVGAPARLASSLPEILTGAES